MDSEIGDEQLLAQGRALVESIVHLALSVPVGGDARWDAMLAKLGVSGLSVLDRQRNLRDGPGQSKGALVIELRKALEAAIVPLCDHMDQPWRLSDAAARALRDYVGAVKPRISSASIFANALATTTNPMRGSADASAEPCICCGAPRVDRSQPSCRYCGEPFTTSDPRSTT